MGKSNNRKQLHFLQGYIENPKIKLNDRAYKYFFISTNYDKMLNEEQRSFLKLVTSNKSTGKFANKISKLVEDAKHNTQ